MDIKRIAALIAATALMTSAPALAVTQTKTINVKWNTQVTATLTLTPNYTAAGAFGGATGAVLTQANGGAGSCTAAPATETTTLVDFGAVTPDSTTLYTDCLFKNAVNATVVTNSTNWNVAVAATAGYVAANGTLCAFPNGTVPTAAVTQSARAAAVTLTAAATCTGGVLMDGTGGTLATSTTAGTAYIGDDYELVLAPNAPTGTTTVTETYTLTAN